MGRDYRIGLAIGLVLAGAALVWVATRPSLGPRLPTVQDSNRSAVAADRPVFLQTTPPAPEANGLGGHKPETRGQKMQEGSASRSASGPQSPAIQSPPAPVVQKKPGPAKAPRVHLVQPGETLSGIAQQYYGSKEDWRKILAANEKTLKDANKIAPGTKLIIPD